MLRTFFDLQSSLRGASIIFSKGLQLQQHDLAARAQSLRYVVLKTGRPVHEAPPHVVVVQPTPSDHPTAPSPPAPPATPKPREEAVVLESAAPTPVASSAAPSPPPAAPSPPPTAAAPERTPVAPELTYEQAFSRFAVEARDPPAAAAPIVAESVPPPAVETVATPEPPAPAPVVAPAVPVADAEPVVAAEPSVVDPIAEPLAEPLTEKPPLLATDDYVAPQLRASRVPSSRFGRLFHYGTLATSLTWGAASESFRRSTSSPTDGPQSSPFLSERNLNRLVDKLGQMRGAALKLGQFLSIQESGSLPKELEEVLRRVQAGADYMPDWQMQEVLRADLGNDWRERFVDFNPIPVASASIGQVHVGSIPSPTPGGKPVDVAVKIQFPGVASSIASDLSNLSLLLTSSALLPKGLYLGSTIKAMRGELKDECDYVREAECARRFGEVLGVGARGEPGNLGGAFRVPRIYDELSSARVLTMERMEGKPLSKVFDLPQEQRDQIGSNILLLCLKELFQFRLMQTDPNWSNFLWNARTSQIELIDFGATREYSKTFMDDWLRLLQAAISDDRAEMLASSLKLGYLLGGETDEMVEAHLTSMSLLGVPFRASANGEPYDFAKQTFIGEVRAQIPVMLRHRLTPPPVETYSLNRKLSGSFLLCARLGSRVDAMALWHEAIRGYEFEQPQTPAAGAAGNL